MGVIAGGIPLDPASSDARSALNFRSADGRWMVAWSGRLDNRGDFAARFGLARVGPGGPSGPGGLGGDDGQLAADAMSAYGIESLGAAIGDFVAVAWDTSARRLWIARDAIGFRPLFYIHEHDHVWFSTEMSGLINGPGRDHSTRAVRAINEGYIAEHLAGGIVNVDETPMEGVRRLLPAEALGFEFGKTNPVRVVLWRPPTTLPARRSDGELIDEFRERFTAAVSRSMGMEARVSAQLSGGLDSTSVAAAARAITGHAPDAYSLVYPSQPVALDVELLDETPYIDAAVAAIGCRSVRFDPLGPDGLRRADFLRVMTAHGEIPDFPVTDALSYSLFSRAAADGHHVMLTGLGGDYWLTGSTSRLAALIRGGRWLDAWQFQNDARRSGSLEASGAEIRAHLFARLTPDWAKAAYRRMRMPRAWPPWLPDDFTTRVQLGARLRRLSARVPPVDDDVLQDSLMTLSAGGLLLARESMFRAATDAGVDVRHPMLDRDFVEFAMTLPDELRMRGGETRYILRRALASWLPPMIRDRRSKGGASTVLAAAISMALAGRSSIDGAASARGWIEPARLWPKLRALSCDGFRQHRPAEGDDHLWFAVAVEIWLTERGA